MNISFALRLVGVITAWAGLLGSLFLLYPAPLFGVLGMLGAMALLLASLATEGRAVQPLTEVDDQNSER